MPNLPQEDDAGNIEYKLRLTNLTMEKVRKRTTQMAFRLKVSLPFELVGNLLFRRDKD